ncbi:MAG: hypothetical protein ACRC1G_06840 [Bradyrhizobium sp.]|nr:hypothetical protein [Bradyrhizobium sp.]
MSKAEFPHWRSDIDSLAFQPAGHLGVCVMHRRAFRALLRALPSPQQCLDFYFTHQPAFLAAASEKMRLKRLAATANFHLTSRDIGRQLRIQVAPAAEVG